MDFIDNFLRNITPFATITTASFAAIQLCFFINTWINRRRFNGFFKKKKPYATHLEDVGDDILLQLDKVGNTKSDLNELIQEINHYVLKTKGTTDFSVIQNKVERKLNMRYDQSTVHLSFPTYIGLMGTFFGVFVGIYNFLEGFDDVDGITDNSITELLNGVLISMLTSLFGLFLTTINTAKAGAARKRIEEDKNEFFDFVQTELMPSLNVSMVVAINKLHETVDRFKPAFDRVINRFQETFDKCTKAFGDNFEKNVVTVSGAVEAMGKNMDKINENIELQERLIKDMESEELSKGMKRYIEASNRFVDITKSLDKFEEARRMMLAAAQETIVLQNKYAEFLKTPREVALRINAILERITTFEKRINELGHNLEKRDLMGNDVINLIRNQVDAIAKKGKITDKYLGITDGKLEDLYTEQTKVLEEMNKRYRAALDQHIAGFEEMVAKQTEDLKIRHTQFLNAMEEKLSIENIQQEFIALRRLKAIETAIKQLVESEVDLDQFKTSMQELGNKVSETKASVDKLQKNQEGIHKEVTSIQQETQKQLDAIQKNTASNRGITIFGRNR